MEDFETIGDKSWPVLWRKDKNSKTEPCPFCNVRHTHGAADGHRVAHCTDTISANGKVLFVVEGFTLSNGRYASPKDGYIVRTKKAKITQ
jgi:hypothetical protein